MSGDIHRLKSWTDYREKRPRTEPGMISEGFKTKAGYHTVVMILGAIGEKEPVTEEWVKAHLRGLGLILIGNPQEEKQ